jgi:hypothetical protein
MMLNPLAVAQALGGDVTGRNVLAPGPGHSRTDRSLSIKIDAASRDGFVVYSFADDDALACRNYVRERLNLGQWTRKTRTNDCGHYRRKLSLDKAVDRKNSDLAQRFWQDGLPVKGTPCEKYLLGERRIDTSVISDVLERDDSIRWCSSILFREPGHPQDGNRLGAIIALQTDPLSGKCMGGISRTYLHENCKVGKAKTLGPGGIVRLSRDEEVVEGLHIAEGLETALSGMAIGLRPMWATGGTVGLSAFPVLSGVECLNILADRDPSGAGEKAARICELRWLNAGKEVRVLMPANSGDVNDALRARGRRS